MIFSSGPNAILRHLSNGKKDTVVYNMTYCQHIETHSVVWRYRRQSQTDGSLIQIVSFCTATAVGLAHLIITPGVSLREMKLSGTTFLTIKRAVRLYRIISFIYYCCYYKYYIPQCTEIQNTQCYQ